MADETTSAASPPEDKGVVPVTQITDIDAVLKAIEERWGPPPKPEDARAPMAEAIRAEAKELGLTNVDRKHAMFPGVAGGDDQEASSKERAAKYIRAALGIDRYPDVATVKALSAGTAAAGGYTVPEEMIPDLIKRTNELSQLWGRVRIRPVTSLGGVIPRLSTDVEMSWDEAENADFDESDPIFDQPTYTVHRMNAIHKDSRELLVDSGLNIVDELTTLFSEAMSRERDKVIVKGDGSTQPEGIFSASGVTTVDSAVG
ncbi:MAG TPA: phage major capsid protein, partial [Phycisphaerae bacterium]|nr:phage major capsid protein [Phycisphaerae bacterium]